MALLKKKSDNNLQKSLKIDDKILSYSVLNIPTKMSFNEANVCVILLITKLIIKKIEFLL